MRESKIYNESKKGQEQGKMEKDNGRVQCEALNKSKVKKSK